MPLSYAILKDNWSELHSKLKLLRSHSKWICFHNLHFGFHSQQIRSQREQTRVVNWWGYKICSHVNKSHLFYIHIKNLMLHIKTFLNIWQFKTHVINIGVKLWEAKQKHRWLLMCLFFFEIHEKLPHFVSIFQRIKKS